MQLLAPEGFFLCPTQKLTHVRTEVQANHHLHFIIFKFDWPHYIQNLLSIKFEWLHYIIYSFANQIWVAILLFCQLGPSLIDHNQSVVSHPTSVSDYAMPLLYCGLPSFANHSPTASFHRISVSDMTTPSVNSHPLVTYWYPIELSRRVLTVFFR
jgi:hypothetical protein